MIAHDYRDRRRHSPDGADRWLRSWFWIGYSLITLAFFTYYWFVASQGNS